MLDVFGTPLDVVQIIGVIIPLHFAAKITNTAVEPKLKVFLSAFESKLIIGKGDGRIDKKVGVHDAVPTQGTRAVAPRNAGAESGLFAVEVEYIASEIPAQKQLVIGPDAIIDFGVEVVAVRTRAIQITFVADTGLQLSLDVGAALGADN